MDSDSGLDPKWGSFGKNDKQMAGADDLHGNLDDRLPKETKSDGKGEGLRESEEDGRKAVGKLAVAVLVIALVLVGGVGLVGMRWLKDSGKY